MIRTPGATLLLGLTVAVTGALVTPAHAAPTAPAQGTPARAAAAGSLSDDLDAILSDNRLKDATVDVVVRDDKAGTVLYDRNGNTKIAPASNNKLQTTAAAFGILGAGYKFRTTVYTKGGNLYLKGTGDPTMRAAEYDKLAAAVKAKGIKKVSGSLVADDTWFDTKRTPAGWDPTDLQFSYAGQTSALTVSPDDVFNADSVKISVTPGAEGKPVKAALTPQTGVVKIDNRTVTGAPGSLTSLAAVRSNGSNTIVLTGSYPVTGSQVDILRTVENPTAYAADVFRRALNARGVKVVGKTKRGLTPKGAKVVTTRTSMPLSQLAVPFVKLSNNVIAETLVKAIGRKVKGKGTWEAGLPAITAYVKKLGVDTTRVTMTDGSGLSRTNRTTAVQLSTLLRNVRKQTWFPAWYAALPVAGQSDQLVGGTLATRMNGTAAAGNVRAKTGTLGGVTALSGYVTDPDGRKLVFSIIFNGYQGGAPKDIEDKIAVRLAGGPSSNTARTTGRTRTVVNGSDLECSWIGTCAS